MWGSEITWFRVWIETNLVFVSGACKIDLLKSWDRNRLDFRVRVEINLVLCGGHKSTWFFCERTVFCAGVKVDLVFMRVENYLFLVLAWKLILVL